jgi:hypothetical protein
MGCCGRGCRARDGGICAFRVARAIGQAQNEILITDVQQRDWGRLRVFADGFQVVSSGS